MKKQYDVIIIGGGPAGIAAGIYSARANLSVLLITKDFGGQIKRKAVEIENYPGMGRISGMELVQKFENHLKEFDVQVIMEKVKNIERKGKKFSVLTENKKQFESSSVIVATGADPRPLEVKGEKELIGNGVSYCVACDGALYKDKITAVIGGGDAGFEAGIFLSKLAKQVYILERGDKIMADKANQQLARKAKNIKVITYAGLREIKGKDVVEAIIYKDNKNETIKTLKVAGVFIEIGNIPATGFVKNLVDFGERDEIKVDPETGETKVPGLFAAGDITDTKYKQIVIAAGEGARAALSASRYLRNIKL
jgi:thioredoxin-disulfide reductase